MPVFSMRKTSFKEVIQHKKEQGWETKCLTTHALGLCSLSWLTELFQSRSNAPMTLHHVVFSAFESTFLYKIQNTHITIQGEALRGHFYLFIRTKANSFFPSSPRILLLMLMGFISASWEEAGEWFSIHMLQFTQYLLQHVGQLKLKAGASFYLCPWL